MPQIRGKFILADLETNLWDGGLSPRLKMRGIDGVRASDYRLDQAIPSGSVPTAIVLVTLRVATSMNVNTLALELVT